MTERTWHSGAGLIFSDAFAMATKAKLISRALDVNRATKRFLFCYMHPAPARVCCSL